MGSTYNQEPMRAKGPKERPTTQVVVELCFQLSLAE